MAFKYYLRGPNNWTELSGRMQHVLARFDAKALTQTHQSMTISSFSMPDVRHGLGRPATYNVTCLGQNAGGAVHERYIRFKDGGLALVKYAETAPDVCANDWYFPAVPAV